MRMRSVVELDLDRCSLERGGRATPTGRRCIYGIPCFSQGHRLPCARRAQGKYARDGTKYGKSRASATNFYTHHAQRISMAAGAAIGADR